MSLRHWEVSTVVIFAADADGNRNCLLDAVDLVKIYFHFFSAKSQYNIYYERPSALTGVDKGDKNEQQQTKHRVETLSCHDIYFFVSIFDIEI